MLLTQKYAPKKLGELIGNEEQLEKIKQWALNWLSGKRKKPIMVYGRAGTGKTSVASALAKEFDLELIEMSASDFRAKANVERVLAGSSSSYSLFGRKKLFLIDDADTLTGKDRGGAGAISKMLKDSAHPVIVTATNAWERSISAIRAECELVQFKKIGKTLVKNLLKKISSHEGISIPEELLDRISDSGGDVRSAINDLQAQKANVRDRDKDVFEIVRGIFKAKTYADAKRYFDSNIDYDLLKLWIDENIPNEYENAGDVAAAYQSLSRADIFERRIKNSAWGYLKYCIDFITAGIALVKKEPYNKFTKYAFPKYLREMSKTVARRAMLKSIGKKIGRRTHVNFRMARDYLPLLKELGKGKEDMLASTYGLEEDEVAFIMEMSVDELNLEQKNGKRK